MKPETENIAVQLLTKMNCRDAHNFIVANIDRSVTFGQMVTIQKRLSRAGQAYLRPLNRHVDPPLHAQPINLEAARRGCDNLRRAIWGYHAKHARCPTARANYARAAAQ